MSGESLSFPDEMEFLEFFGAAPVESSAQDGYWCYAIADARGICLRFSFSMFERSVQTVVHAQGSHLATIVYEGATEITIDKETLTCVFLGVDCRATLVLRVAPEIRLEWSRLRRE